MRDLKFAQAEGPLGESIRYSLWQKGKRFRPTLCLLWAEAFGISPQRVLPLAMAVEMLHTYSLIHDDLPCMDDDDVRRGEPTNHKIFGEDMALLAGDALQAEAFAVIAGGHVHDAKIGMHLVQLLAEAVGSQGMVGGQAVDIRAEGKVLSRDELLQMHAMKTGALIRLASEGVAVVAGLPLAKQQCMRRFGEELGLAFQLADDLLDSSEQKLEPGSFPALVGWAAAQEMLSQVSKQAFALLCELGIEKGPLHDLVQFNLERRN